MYSYLRARALIVPWPPRSRLPTCGRSRPIMGGWSPRCSSIGPQQQTRDATGDPAKRPRWLFRHSLGLLVGCRDSKWLQRCGVLYFYVRYEPMSVALLTPQSIERPSGLILHDRPPGPSRPIPPDARPLLSARYNARCNALRHLPSRQPFSSIPRRRIISGSVSIRRSIVHRRWRRRSIQERCS
jgi:hypothetical protein